MPGMLVLRAHTSSGSTPPGVKTMLLFSVQYGSTTEIRLISASSKRSPYGWSRLCAACPEKRAFIPIDGFARFEYIDDGWAVAMAGAHISAANRNVCMRE